MDFYRKHSASYQPFFLAIVFAGNPIFDGGSLGLGITEVVLKNKPRAIAIIAGGGGKIGLAD